MMLWVIRCNDPGYEELYWSVDLGWTSRSEATVFDNDEKDFCALPRHGKWERYQRGAN